MLEENKRSIEKIKELAPADLLEEFEECLRKGAGINSVPFLWYRSEILFRLEKEKSCHC